MTPALAPWQTRAVWEDAVCASMPTAAGVAVVLRLARYMSWRERQPGWNGDPGLARLAADLHLGEKQISRYLTEAERRGLIVTTRRHAPRSRTQPHAAYAAAMPAPAALFDPPAASEDQAPPAADGETVYPTPVSGKEPTTGQDQQTPMSGKNQDQQTPMSGNRDPLLYPSLSSSSSSQIPLPPTSIGGGGGDQSTDDTIRVVAELARMVRGGASTELAIRARVVELLTAGYTPGEITRHAETRTATGRTRGTIAHPAGLLRHVLADIPPSQAELAADREAQHQRDAAHRRQLAAAADPTDHAALITDALGPALHGRIVTAELARLAQPAPGVKNPGAAPGAAARAMTASLARSPARIRALVAGVYLEHHYELDAVRAYAESLPPGPAETAQDDTTVPTPTGHVPMLLRRAEGA